MSNELFRLVSQDNFIELFYIVPKESSCFVIFKNEENNTLILKPKTAKETNTCFRLIFSNYKTAKQFLDTHLNNKTYSVEGFINNINHLPTKVVNEIEEIK